MEVLQNSYPYSLVAGNNQNQCCAPAWDSCADYHCSEEALGLRLSLNFSFATQAYESDVLPTC
jgi:hypothetical protein